MKIKTVFVIGCGDSAKDWHKTPHDYSIGVNDCIKFGHHPNTLILVNAPHKFQPTKENGYQNRLAVIKTTKPQEVISNDRGIWAKHFPDRTVREIKTQTFFKADWFRKDIYYHSRTSTFIGISYAYNLGAEKIVIWGCDLLNHPNFPAQNRETEFEKEQYLKLIGAIQNQGTEVFIGNEKTFLNQYLEVYRP
jgi:hypothetical protein